MSSQTKELREAKKLRLRLLGELLGEQTRIGELYQPLENNRVLCYSCGHRCRIADGLAGVCKVRFNRDGKLYVPWGYVAGLQNDPIEKKPFFHVLPGTEALSFGMLGCDLHCAYCFTGETIVMTDCGPITLQEAFQSAKQVTQTIDGEIVYPVGLQVVTANGNLQPVRAVFKHSYQGRLAILQFKYLPELHCTPDHRVYATEDPNIAPQPIQAQHLTNNHMLAVPKHYPTSVQVGVQTIDVAEILSIHQITYRIPWKLSAIERERIVAATAEGFSSRQIGQMFGKSVSYIRHVRSKIVYGRAVEQRTQDAIVEGNFLRFPNEHRPGISKTLLLDKDLATLLGYYCAEGSVVRGKDRSNSYTLNFSFAHSETTLAEQVCQLIERCFGVKAYLVKRETTLGVAVTKSSLALLFKGLAGSKANQKRVPAQIFQSPPEIVQAFLTAYVQGDGHCYSNGKISTTTVSTHLAYGVAQLVLGLGYFPAIYQKRNPQQGHILGRDVNCSPYQYTLVWYSSDSQVERKFKQSNDYYFIPLRSIDLIDYQGDVYNLEVAVEHNYLAGNLLVSNCQNWITSQVLRDPDAKAPAHQITAEEMLQIAEREHVSTITSTYNEPLITSEWAVSIFQQAKARGFLTSYVSNGNGTPEVLDYIRPWVDLYKVDLKSFRDRHYRELGGLLVNVLDTIRGIKERGFWLEIVTLVVPQFNDSLDELREMAEFIVSVDPFIPWHLTAFYGNYKMRDRDNTAVDTLIRAAEIGRQVGLKYIYVGNMAGRVERWENTWCHNCDELLIERFAYHIRQNRIEQGRCPKCQVEIPGRWSSPRFEQQQLKESRLPRTPRPMGLS